MQRIKETFHFLNLHPVYLEHEPVISSEEAARTRGFELKQGIKTIVLTNGSNDWVIVNIPADQKVDMKKVAFQLNWSKSKIRMATELEVMEKTGCQIGAVPPFGHKSTIPLLVDNGIFNNNFSAFNIGLRTNSVKIPTNEMRIVFKKVNAIEGDFVK